MFQNHSPAPRNKRSPASISCRVLAICVTCLPLLVSAEELVRDETVIRDLLENGRLILSEHVASVLPVEQSLRQIRRVGLEKDGTQIRAAFRDKSVRIDSREKGGGRFHDAYYNEVAAFVISHYLGLNIVPPTVLRSLLIASRGLKPGDQPIEGSLQLWIENGVVEYDREKQELDHPGDPLMRNQQLKEIRIFDCIIGNLDRHAGNLLVDFNPRFPAGEQASGAALVGKLWAIDHTRAFHSSAGVPSEHCRLSKINTQPVSLVFIQRLRLWQLEEVEQALRASGLSDRQLARLNLGALDRRAQKVRSYIDSQQQRSQLDDEAFFSSGNWHRVW